MLIFSRCDVYCDHHRPFSTQSLPSSDLRIRFYFYFIGSAAFLLTPPITSVLVITLSHNCTSLYCDKIISIKCPLTDFLRRKNNSEMQSVILSIMYIKNPICYLYLFNLDLNTSSVHFHSYLFIDFYFYLVRSVHIRTQCP